MSVRSPVSRLGRVPEFGGNEAPTGWSARESVDALTFAFTNVFTGSEEARRSVLAVEVEFEGEDAAELVEVPDHFLCKRLDFGPSALDLIRSG